MLRGYRGVFIAAFGWLTLAGAQPPNQQSQGPTKTEQPKQPPTPEQPFVAYGDLNAESCYRAKSHDAADLCAQWRAAIAAEKAAHEARRSTSWSIVATFLSAAAIMGLLVTIRQTKAALRIARHSANLTVIDARRARNGQREAAAFADLNLAEARKATTAAEQSALYSQEALRANRAWITFKDIQTFYIENIVIDGVPTKGAWGFNLCFLNTGQSPAIKARAYTDWRWCEPDDGFINPQIPLDVVDLPTTTIGIGGRVEGEMWNLSQPQLDDVYQERFALYVYNRVYYSDLFTKDVRRVTEICLRIMITGFNVDSEGRRMPIVGIAPVAGFDTLT